jgi:hypothetical protein
VWTGASVHDNTGTGERELGFMGMCHNITRGRIPACFCSFRMWEDCEPGLLRCDTRDHKGGSSSWEGRKSGGSGQGRSCQSTRALRDKPQY